MFPETPPRTLKPRRLPRRTAQPTPEATTEEHMTAEPDQTTADRRARAAGAAMDRAVAAMLNPREGAEKARTYTDLAGRLAQLDGVAFAPPEVVYDNRGFHVGAAVDPMGEEQAVELLKMRYGLTAREAHQAVTEARFRS